MTKRERIVDEASDRVLVRLLRDLPVGCECCGEGFKAGDEVFMPHEDAEEFVQIGDAVFVTDQPQ
jgi:hypothetical protein